LEHFEHADVRGPAGAASSEGKTNSGTTRGVGGGNIPILRQNGKRRDRQCEECSVGASSEQNFHMSIGAWLEKPIRCRRASFISPWSKPFVIFEPGKAVQSLWKQTRLDTRKSFRDFRSARASWSSACGRSATSSCRRRRWRRSIVRARIFESPSRSSR